MKTLKLFILVFYSSLLSAQPYGNEWIDYSQKFYKFKVAASGLYKIDYQTLVAANVPLSTIQPANLQIFGKGKEQPIYIQGGQDGVFDPTDYITFYAAHNDGWLDTVFYKGAKNQPNPYYSLINDTLTYYLSWNNQQNNLRFQEENAIDFSNYFPAPFVWQEKVESFNNQYYDGEILTAGATDPEYVNTEGYMSAPITIGRQKTFNTQINDIYRSGPSPKLELKVAGASNWGQLQNGDHHLQLELGNFKYDKIFEGYQLIHLDTSIAVQSLATGNNTLSITSIDDLSTQNGRVDRMALAYFKITYPRQLSFSGATETEFLLDDHLSLNAQYLEIKNFNGGSNPLLFDLSNQKKIKVVKGINEYKAIVPNGSGRKKCVLSSAAAIREIQQINLIGNNGYFTDYQSLSSDSNYVIISHPSLKVETSTYAAYRQSKGHQVLTVNIEELYHQFGFGIEKNPLAIRNFVDAYVHDWSKKMTNLFLLGKSVSVKSHRNNAAAFRENLVPTMGNPATDNLLTAGLGNTFLETLVPQGRLSAKTESEVANYLNKVIDYESATADLWMKNALHFAGGNSKNETNVYAYYLSRFGNYYKDIPYGGNVRIFKKSTSSPYQTTLSDSIRNLINSGVGLMTFFGHASATGDFDISIDDPDQLQNTGKYPLILANSCFSGNYHQSAALSTGEAYVLEKDKGAIGFIANGNLGMPYALSIYSEALYKSFSKTNYGASWTESMREAVKAVQGPDIVISLKIICLDMALQGDPALKPYHFSLPDYKVAANNIQISPGELSTSLKDFAISINVENIGKATGDTVAIQLNHSYPSANQDTVYTRLLPAVLYDSVVVFTIPVDLFKSAGTNKFTVLLDPLNQIKEGSEMNNRYDFSVDIRSGEILPIDPPNFSIVGNLAPTLSASTVYAFEEEREYVFELDSTPDFNSSWKSDKTISSFGGLIQWTPTKLAQMQDSAVYYWRISKTTSNGGTRNWQSSSFQYIPQDSGWSQSDFGQFEENDQLFLKGNRNNGKFEFASRSSELFVKTIGEPSIAQTSDVFYRIDADVRERNGCGGGAGFFIAVLDSLTLKSWETPYNGENQQNYFGQANADNYCGANRQRSEKYFLFRQKDALQMQAMRDFIDNEIPNGSYVVIYNWFKIDYSTIWQQDSSILKAIENLGSSKIRTIPDGYPFIFTAKKGDVSSVLELAGDSVKDFIELSRTLTTNADFGKMVTPKIGPSEKWVRLSYDFDQSEQLPGDSLRYQLMGSTTEGNTYSLLNSNKFELDTSLSFIGDSIQLLHMELTAYDQSNFTPPQLQHWQVNYRQSMDYAIAPNLFFEQNKDSLERGELLEVKFAVKSIGHQQSDSLSVRYVVSKNGGNELLSKIEKYAIDQKDTFHLIEAEIQTRLLSGNNTLLIEVNPENLPLEQHRFNNSARLHFVVETDRLNPLIDITVDGRKIMNGELVSSKPEIVINLKDENNFLAIDDTSSLAIFLRKPNGKEITVNYNSKKNNNLIFIPAKLPDNEAKVIYTPFLKEDGKYQLRVQAKDASGNAAKEDYAVEFEVINRSTVTHLLNYPNPFSTSTRFVFTLTGSQIPDQIQIQIMTVTGKVVREIDQHELGPIHIGNNITDYAWDGKDDYGDQLANGVYLYRVKMKISGNNIEHRNTNADKFFKKNFGKMYLLR